MLHKMPFILALIIALIILLDPYMPLQTKEALYALSLTIKSAIIFTLPFIIFMLLFKTVSQLASRATKMILIIVAAVCCSNFISTLLSYVIGSNIYQLDLSLSMPSEALSLHPLWSLSFPKFIGNDIAMLLAVVLGLASAFVNPTLASSLSSYFEKWVNNLLKLILLVIPFFIAGFVIKMVHDKALESIVRDYALIFVVVALAQFTYISFVYFAACRFNITEFIRCVKNIIPAAISAFGSMSSAASMPLTIIGTEKNTENPDLTRLCIPATVNIHLIGDCFAIPIFAFAVLKNFGMPEPAFATYLIFALYFVLAKFSVAAVPGGGILVMLPILETHLGFNAEMSSLITALYILFDPVITCANVCGNGGFALVLNRLTRFRQPETS